MPINMAELYANLTEIPCFMKAPKNPHILCLCLVLILSISLFAGCQRAPSKDPLTTEERHWLAEHDGRIVLGHDPNANPIEFTDENGAFRGIAADYVKLIEERLNFKFNIVNLDTWNEAVKKARDREVDVLCAFTKNPDREKWMLFTEPYLIVPTVILTRKDDDRSLTIDKMKDMRVTFTKGWIVDGFLRKQHSGMNLVPATDAHLAMNYLLTGQADAWVTALTVATIEIEKNRVTNLRVAGETELSFKLSFASRQDWPMLNRILDKGLKLITEDERQAIFNKWIHIEIQNIFSSHKFWMIVLFVALLLLLPTLFISIWNKSLKKEVERQTTALKNELAERKKAEKALREMNKIFQALLEHSPIYVFFKDQEMRSVYLSRNYETMLGRPLESILGKTMDEIFPSELAKGIIEDDKRILSEGKLIQVDEELNGRHYATIKFPIVFDGKPVMLAGFTIDITDRKKAEEEKVKLVKRLLQSQKMESIGTLAGGIAHDFNNMLGVLTGNISYALSKLNRGDELFDLLSEVLRATKRARNLTHQLLTFAKGGEPIKKSVKIGTLLEESSRFVTSGAKSKCKFKLSDDLWAADIDEGQINQVISNLVINADQAMPKGGIITVRAENTEVGADKGLPLPAGRYVKIVIEDQGVGIQKTHIPSIFDPYFTTKQKGSGLGLATVYSIVKRHGGHISVYSEVGKGTSFTIHLPASTKDIKEAGERKAPEHSGHGNILIMDDQEQILKMVGMILNRMGYHTAFATDGTQAIDMYREAYQAQKPFDLVILDLTVPGGMGGAEAIAALLKIDPDIKAVVSSGFSTDPIMANYQDYGFVGVVPKPYTMDHLVELLNGILGEKRRSSERIA